MHLGLPGWHYAFTDVGLSPSTQQWFRMLSPERLAIDMAAHQARQDAEHGIAAAATAGAAGGAKKAAAAAAAAAGAPPKPPSARKVL